MARFDTSSLDETFRQMKTLGEASGEVADDMLLAGAEEVKEAWKEAAGLHGLRWSGDMIKSIGYARKPKNINGVREIDIYPQGTDRKGVRNAEKAFILHYGTSGSRKRKEAKSLYAEQKKYKGPGIPATHWVDDADAISAETAPKAMQGVWNQHLHSKGLI